MKKNGFKIAIWAGSSLNNIGDILLANVTRAELSRRLPNSTFHDYCPWSKRKSPRKLWINENSYWPGQGQYNAVIIAGGGVFCAPPFIHPAMQVFCFGPRPSEFDPAVKAIWHGVGVQDSAFSMGYDYPHVDHGIRTNYLNDLIDRLDYIGLRDSGPLLHLPKSAAPRAQIAPDPVFALPPCTEWRKRLKRPRNKEPRILAAVGIPGMSPRLMQELGTPLPVKLDYSLAEWNAKQLADQREFKSAYLCNVHIALLQLSEFSHLEFLAVDNFYDDASLARQLASSLRNNRIFTVTASDIANGSMAQLSRLLVGFDVLLTSRFHMAILGLWAGIPIVAVESAPSTASATKLFRLMQDCKLEKQYWRLSTNRNPSEAETIPDAVQAALELSLEDRNMISDSQYLKVQKSFDSITNVLTDAI